MSAASPTLISSIIKKASFVHNLKSAAVTKSIPPPIQPPWIAAITGKRAASRQLVAFCRYFNCCIK